MKQDIINTVQKALDSLNAEWGVTLPDIEVELPKDEAMGDIAITVAMRLTKLLKKPPRKIAEEIIGK